MSFFLQFTTLFMTYLIVNIGQGMAHIYERKVASGDCDLVLTCSFHQIPVKSEGHCAVLAMSLEDSGFYHNSSAGICNICKPGLSATTYFTKINIDSGYFSESKWNSVVGEHNETKWLPFFRQLFQIHFPLLKLLYFDSPKFIHRGPIVSNSTWHQIGTGNYLNHCIYSRVYKPQVFWKYLKFCKKNGQVLVIIVSPQQRPHLQNIA